MEKVYTSSDYSSQLLSQMSELWRGNKYCDAVLNLQDERFKLHKLVLMAACPNILRCLAHTEENNVFEFYLPEDVEKSAVRLIVNYLYIGSIQLNMANVYGIEKLAKQLRLSTLSQFCHDFISLLETETLSQSLVQPGIHQEYIPKHESTEVEMVVDPSAVDAFSNSANATLTEINNGNSLLPQSTDGFGQLPLASKSIKTELDAYISPTLEEAISKNKKKTITIEPLLVKNILQVSKSDNYITTASATDSATLDQHLSSDKWESHPVSHQTSSMRTKDPQINSCQASTITSLTPVPSKRARNCFRRPRKEINNDSRLDDKGHWPTSAGGSDRLCTVCNKKHRNYLASHPGTSVRDNPYKRTKTTMACEKCDVALCCNSRSTCFRDFHTKVYFWQ